LMIFYFAIFIAVDFSIISSVLMIAIFKAFAELIFKSKIKIGNNSFFIIL